jgi:uncharacterized protein (TIGR02646 family)
MPIEIDLFFPQLPFRTNYKRKRNNNYYSNYSVYREAIRIDCLGRCVYCDIHENENGGQANMHLDHFRPKEKFRHLRSNPNNLHWSCAECNNLKSDYWPAESPDLTINGEQGFIDPFTENRKDYFKVAPSGELIPLKAPASYKIELLALNREYRKRVRKNRLIVFKMLTEERKRIAEVDAILKNRTDLSKKEVTTLKKLKRTINASIRHIMTSDLNFDLL